MHIILSLVINIEGCAMEAQQDVLCCCQQYETNLILHIKCQVIE